MYLVFLILFSIVKTKFYNYENLQLSITSIVQKQNKQKMGQSLSKT